jgi:hypothetical protein
MHRGYRYFSSLLLTAALSAPLAMMAASPQEDRGRENKNQENRQNQNNRRYYDRSHKDYHTWDDNEGRAYQRYQTDHHQTRDFNRLNRRQQTRYWGWRHNNPDHD